MLHVDDLLAEPDVLALDSTVLETFGEDEAAVSARLTDKRTVAVQMWLRQRMEAAGHAPVRHAIRLTPTKALGYTGGAFSDVTSAVSDKTLDDLNLTTVFVTPASDALYVASGEPFRSLWVSMTDTVNINTLTVGSPSYWNGGKWSAFTSMADGTMIANSIAFSGGGRISWQQPTDWAKRPLNGEETWRYWMRLAVNRTPSTSTKAAQVLPVRMSRLTHPAALYALGLLYGESWGSQRGEWKEKAERYLTMADEALTQALPLILDEMLVEDAEAVDHSKINSIVGEQASRPDLFTWQRG